VIGPANHRFYTFSPPRRLNLARWRTTSTGPTLAATTRMSHPIWIRPRP